MEKGVLFVATGNEKYIKQAVISRNSLKRFDPDLKTAIYTDQETDNQWSEVIEAKNEVDQEIMTSKITGMLNSPFNKTLFLDTDTFVLGKIDSLFDLLSKFDIAYAPSHFNLKKSAVLRGKFAEFGISKKLVSDNIPSSFLPIQSGVMLIKKDTTRTFLKEVLNSYKDKNWWDDQVAFYECLWNSDLNSYILPRSYNFCSLWDWIFWRHLNYEDLRPIIWHYTLHKKHLKKKDLYKIEKILHRGNKLEILLLLTKLRLFKSA